MKVINFKNLEEVGENSFILGGDEIYGIKENTVTDSSIEKDFIPHIKINSSLIYTLIKNGTEIYILDDIGQGLSAGIILKQEMINNKIVISDLELTLIVEYHNILYNFVNSYKDNIKQFTKHLLNKVISMLPNSKAEKEWYNEKIIEYIDNKHIEKPIVKRKYNTTKKKYNEPVEYNGVKYKNVSQLCNQVGLVPATVLSRIKYQGMSLKEAIETPIRKSGRHITKTRKE